MATSDDLTKFVRDALTRGLSRESIAGVLGKAGWDAAEVRSTLAGFADVDFPLPVPKPRPYLSAREAFLYLVLFTTLYISAGNLVNLLFDLVNQAYPDPTMSPVAAQVARASIRWSVSSLIIAFPVFLGVSALTSRGEARDPLKRQSKVRRWLTYLTLFVAATVLIGDFITLVNSVLAGELTSRFVLKVMVVAAIAGTIFGYYLLDLRREEKEAAS